jgi:hypothetical protein
MPNVSENLIVSEEGCRLKKARINVWLQNWSIGVSQFLSMPGVIACCSELGFGQLDLAERRKPVHCLPDGVEVGVLGRAWYSFELPSVLLYERGVLPEGLE